VLGCAEGSSHASAACVVCWDAGRLTLGVRARAMFAGEIGASSVVSSSGCVWLWGFGDRDRFLSLLLFSLDLGTESWCRSGSAVWCKGDVCLSPPSVEGFHWLLAFR
jgi:hypothetical protein